MGFDVRIGATNHVVSIQILDKAAVNLGRRPWKLGGQGSSRTKQGRWSWRPDIIMEMV